MAERQGLIVGGEHNRPVSACYLARAGLDVTLQEQRAVAGGAVHTAELLLGYRAPIQSPRRAPAGPYRPARRLQANGRDQVGCTLIVPVDADVAHRAARGSIADVVHNDAFRDRRAEGQLPLKGLAAGGAGGEGSAGPIGKQRYRQHFWPALCSSALTQHELVL